MVEAPGIERQFGIGEQSRDAPLASSSREISRRRLSFVPDGCRLVPRTGAESRQPDGNGKSSGAVGEDRTLTCAIFFHMAAAVKTELHELVDAMTDEQAAKVLSTFRRVGNLPADSSYQRDRKRVADALERFANSNAEILAELAK